MLCIPTQSQHLAVKIFDTIIGNKPFKSNNVDRWVVLYKLVTTQHMYTLAYHMRFTNTYEHLRGIFLVEDTLVIYWTINSAL